MPTAEDFPSGSSSSSATIYKIDINPESPDHYLVDHCIDGRIIFPGTGYLCLVWKTLARALDQNMEHTPVVFEDVTLHQAVILPKTGIVLLEVRLLEASCTFEVSENGNLIASGKVYQWEDPNPKLFDNRYGPDPATPWTPQLPSTCAVVMYTRSCSCRASTTAPTSKVSLRPAPKATQASCSGRTTG